MSSFLDKINELNPDNNSGNIKPKNIRTSFAEAEKLIGKLSSGFQGSLKKSDPRPTQKGVYFAIEIGIYPNINNLEAKTGKLNIFTFDEANWDVIRVDIDSFNLSESVKTWILSESYTIYDYDVDSSTGIITDAIIKFPDGKNGTISNVILNAEGQITSIKYNYGSPAEYSFVLTVTYVNDKVTYSIS